MKTWMIALVVMVLSASAIGCGGGATEGSGGSTGGGSSGTSTTSSTDVVGGTGGSMQSGASVTVSTTDQHQAPVPNVPVVVNDAAGAVVLVTQSGPDGTVPVSVPAGGSVAAFASYGLNFDVQAVVEPPDHATVRFSIWVDEATSLPDKTTFPVAFTQIPSGTQKIEVSSCGPTGQAYPPSFGLTMDNAGCTKLGTTTFLAIALGAQDKLLAWGTAVDQPNNPGASTSIQIALSHTNFEQIDGTITDIIPGASRADITVYGDVDATSLVSVRAYGSQSKPISTYATQLAFPAGIFKSYRMSEYVTIDGATASSYVARERVYAKLPTSTIFDGASIAFVSVNPLNVSDPVHPQATWSLGAGSRGDYGAVFMRWGGGIASTSYKATFPPDHALSFRVPDFPPELSSFAPVSTSTFGYTAVEYTDDERVSGYGQSASFNQLAPADGLGTVWSNGGNKESSP